MNLRDLPGRSFDCACGRTHALGLREWIHAPGAAAELPRVLAPLRRAGRLHLVADRRTFSAAGGGAEARLQAAGWAVARQIVADPPGGGDPVCDERARAALEAALDEPWDLLLAVGSGVVNDLCKWIAHDRGRPYAALATAASMNGYASANIAPAVGGVKRVLPGTVPIAVVADPAVLAAAPHALTAAGLGDVLAKPVSTADWHVNAVLFGEYWCPFCAGLLREVEPLYLGDPEGVRRHAAAPMAALFEALVGSGIAMTLAGTSFPASGGEHLVSHVLDMKALAEGGAHDLHGRQVGIGTIFCAALYERLLALEAPAWRAAAEPTDAAYWGPLAAAVETEHAGKRRAAARAAARLREPGAWDAARAAAREHLLPAALLKDVLRRAGAAHTLADLGCPRGRYLDAVRRCHQVRARFTVVDLARAAGLLPGVEEEIVEEWLLE